MALFNLGARVASRGLFPRQSINLNFIRCG